MSQRSGHRGIVVAGLVKEYPGGLRAVDGIDIEVEEGEIYGFLGPNGAGKSTTVLMLTTLLPITGGRASVGGYDVATQGREVRGVMGAALQEVALDPMLTGREHTRLQGALHGIDGAERARRGDDLLERVGLADAADRKTGSYSGGMKRRLDLALALIHRPSILFLDEPTTGLDPQSRLALWDEVSRLTRDEGVTVLLTTQYLEEADALARRVGIINKGTIVAEGTPAALKAQVGTARVDVVAHKGDDERVRDALTPLGSLVHTKEGVISVRLGSADLSVVDVVRALDARNLVVSDLSVHEPTLDDVFLAKTGVLLEGAVNGAPSGQ